MLIRAESAAGELSDVVLTKDMTREERRSAFLAAIGRNIDDKGQQAMTTTAPKLLNRAAELLEERGKQYDQPSGERSMAKTVAAFNSITGRDLTEREGWEFMLVLKQVRLFQIDKHHQDSAEDAISYAALLAECSAR